eukprot:4188857-Pleurochrysis_carterae.AAC.3
MWARMNAAASTHNHKLVVARRASVRSGATHGNGKEGVSVRLDTRTDADTLGLGKDRGATVLKTTMMRQLLATRGLHAESGGGGYAESTEERSGSVHMIKKLGRRA